MPRAAESSALPRFGIGLRKRRPLRRNRFISFLVSGALHGGLLGLGGWVLMQPARYGMEAGSGGMELYLVAAPPGGVSANVSRQAPVPPPVPAPEGDFFLPEPLPATGSERFGGNSPVTFYSPGGGKTDVSTTALKNPAPPYPPLSRRLGQEGTVVLRIAVDREGRPVRVEIGRSSGYPLLDGSALSTLNRWKFIPARVGGVPVDSEGEMKIRFRLEENAGSNDSKSGRINPE